MTKKDNHIQLSAFSELNFEEPQDQGHGVPIQGFCIHEGLYKEIVEIPEAELNNVEKTIKNAQFRIDHSHSVRDVVGLVNYSETGFDNIAQKPGVRYEALVKDEEIAGKIQQGLVNDVSIGFDLEPECSVCGEDFRRCEHWFDEAHIIARNVNVFELSLVTRGADSDAYASVIGFAEQFSDKLQKLEKSKEDFKKFKFEDLVKGGNFMAEKDGNVDVNKVVDQLSAAQKEALEEKQAKEALAKQLEAFKKEKEALAKEKEALAKEKDALSEEKDKIVKERDEFKGKFEEASGTLGKQELDAKKEGVEAIVKLEVEKKITKEAEFDARVEKLMGIKDEEALSIIKDYAESFKVAQSNKPKINAIEGFNKFTRQDGIVMDLDAFLDDTTIPKKVKDAFHQRMVHEVFRFDRVYKGELKEGVVEGKTYMGFTLHEDN